MRLAAILLASPGVVLLPFASPALAESAPAQPAKQTAKDTIVVTGTREQSNEVKRDAKIVLDVRSQEEIRSLPDVNAAEALQRLPGVSMETDSGEGRFVNIRGLDADLNGTTYDGIRLTASNPATPQGGARAVAFDAFPAGVLGGVEVIKSLSPDMDAEGLGGVVNIVPRSIPAGQSLLVQGGLGIGVEKLRNNPRYQGDITLGAGLGGETASGQKRLSLIVSYAYDKDNRAIDDVEADYINDPTLAPAGTDAYLASKLYDDLQPRNYSYHRTRQGISGGLTFRPDDDTTLFIRGIHAGYVENAYKHEYKLNDLSASILTVDNATGDVNGDGATAKEVAISTREELGNDLVEAGGNTQFGGGIKLDFRGAYTEGHDRFPYALNASWATPNPFAVTYNDTANYNVPTYHSTDGTNLADPTIYTKFKGDNGPSYNSDQEWSGMLALAVPLGPDAGDGEIKFGGAVRARKRIQHAYSADMISPGQSYAAFNNGHGDVFYGGAYDIGPYPDFAKVEAIAQTPQSEDLTAFEHDNENVYAGYGQYSGTFGQLSLIGGVRVEATDATYRANVQDANTEVITPNSATHHYTNVFPDLSLKYSASDRLLFRAAFTTAIGRPGFNQITAAKTIDRINFVVSQGNPDVKPTIGRNFDLTAEYYTPMGGLLSVGLFYKAFSDYIIGTVQPDVKNYPDPSIPAGQGVEVDSYQNIGSAWAEGIEFNLRQPFSFLPGALSGFGVEANLTLVDSSGLVHQHDTQKSKLPQMSPVSANLALYYEKGPLSARIAASYVSRNLWAVGDDAATDLYSQPRFRLDASASYAITKQVELFAEAKNLTNTKLEFTQTADKRYPVQREYYDMDFLGGIRINFGR